MTAFVDSSAVVKRYVEEAGAEVVARIELLVVSALARVEVGAALWAKHRLGELDARDSATLASAFEAELDKARGPYIVVPVTAEVLRRATRVVAVHPLRTLDAVQLATALAARDAEPAIDEFVTFDRVLTRAAAIEGFRVLPAT